MIKGLVKRFLVYKKSKMFRKRCIVGEHTVFGLNSSVTCDKIKSISIGKSCDIHCTLITQDNGKISIGNNVTIRSNSKIGAVNNISIGDNVIISNNVTIYDNNNHPTGVVQRDKISKNMFDADVWRWRYADNSPVIIEDNVWIGERVSILKGVRIGYGSVVGMGAVVTKDVPPNAICAGNPAKVVKYLQGEQI